MTKHLSSENIFGPKTSYDKWLETEGIEVITGYHISDLRKVPLKPWKRKGGMGAFINLEGAGQTNDAYLCEIPPGGSLKPERYLFEELIFILDGEGETQVWNEGKPKRKVLWGKGSLFSPPLNTWHQHFNRSGDKPTRYVVVTSAPTVINLFHNQDFVFRNPFVFEDRYNSEEDYFSGQGKHYPDRIWESNFVPDVMTFQLKERLDRGAKGTMALYELANNTLAAHVSEFPVGSYKKAHSHGGGAHVIILSGKGYSLMWKQGMPFKKFDWQEGSMLVPPDYWFHQHFNTGKTPVRYLALRWGGRKYRTTHHYSGDQIEYEDEDPSVRKIFEEELAKEGIKIKTPPVVRKDS